MLKAYSRASARINSLRTEEEGTAAEYALIIGLIAVGSSSALTRSRLRAERHVRPIVTSSP